MRRLCVQTLPRWRLLPLADRLPLRQLRFSSQSSEPWDDQVTGIDDELPVAGFPGSTITLRERRIFEKLFSNIGHASNLSPASSRGQIKHPHDVVDELPEEIQGMAMGFAERVRYKQYMAELKITLGEDAKLNSQPETPRVKRLRELRVQEHDRILSLLNSAKSDLGLWEVLQKELFLKIKVINLEDQQLKLKPEKKRQNINEKSAEEETTESKASKTTSTKAKSSQDGPPKLELSDFEVLGPNYSRLLLAAIRRLRTHFPTSQFPFTIYTEMKRLGLQSYALGASTRLFNELILASWKHQGDFYRVSALLEEMERTGIDFDWETLEIIMEIRKVGSKALDDENKIVQKVAHLEFFRNGSKKIVMWNDFIKSRLEAEALRQANEDMSTLVA